MDTELLSVQDEKRRADKLATNCKWLISKINEIHEILCPELLGTWQQQANDCVIAARDIKRILAESRGSLHRISVEIQAINLDGEKK